MDYLAIAKKIVAKTVEQGAEGEVYVQTGSETNIEVAKGKVEKLSRAGSKGMGIRVIRDGKVGYAYTSDFSDESIESTRRAAMELVEVVDQDEYRKLPELQEVMEEDLEIYDPAIVGLSTDDKVKMALKIEQAALDFDPRVILVQMCTYIDAIETVYLVNSKGFEGSYQKTMALGFLAAIAREGDQTTEAMAVGASTYLEDLDMAKIGEQAGKDAVSMLGGKPVPTQEASIVFTPITASEIIYYLSQAMTGESMQRKRSFLVDKLGKEVAADNITLLDNGRLKRGMDTVPFDAEGVPTRATRLIDEGVFQNVLYDSYSASKDGKESTGNASRGSHRGAPSLSPSNFYLQPGNQTPGEIIAGVEKGFYVLSTMNVGGINQVSGDYSVGASGLWIEDGVLTDPVSEVTIAMPLDALLNSVKVVGSDLTFVPFYGAIGAPTIRVDGMTISGK